VAKCVQSAGASRRPPPLPKARPLSRSPRCRHRRYVGGGDGGGPGRSYDGPWATGTATLGRRTTETGTGTVTTRRPSSRRVQAGPGGRDYEASHRMGAAAWPRRPLLHRGDWPPAAAAADGARSARRWTSTAGVPSDGR
jgi:hypothetical protein